MDLARFGNPVYSFKKARHRLSAVSSRLGTSPGPVLSKTDGNTYGNQVAIKTIPVAAFGLISDPMS